MDVESQAHRERVDDSKPWPRSHFACQPYEQSASNQSCDHQPRIAARVLRKPHVMVRESEQRGGGECFGAGGDDRAEPGERSNAGNAEECRGKPQGPGAIAENYCAQVRKHRVENVLILVVESADDVCKGLTHVVNERVDLVEPQSVTQVVQSYNRCREESNGEN